MNNFNEYLCKQKEYSNFFNKKQRKSLDLDEDLEIDKNKGKYLRSPNKTKRLWSAKVSIKKLKRVMFHFL